MKFKLFLLAAILLPLFQCKCAYRTALKERGLQDQITLSAGDSPLLYRYECQSTASVTTSSQSEFTVRFFIAAVQMPELSTDSTLVWSMLVENYTDYRGNDEIGFNDSRREHQALFVLKQDVATGDAIQINISSQLEPKYLLVAKDVVLRHFTPTFADSAKLSLSLRQSATDNLLVLSSHETGEGKLDEQTTLAVSTEGVVQQSNATYSKEILGNGYNLMDQVFFGEPGAPIKLSAKFNFNLKEKVPASPELLSLINEVISKDKTITPYTRQAFVAMVEATAATPQVQMNSAAVLSSSTKEVQGNLRLASPIVKAPTGKEGGGDRREKQQVYPVHQKQYMILESWFLGRAFRVYLETNITLVLLEERTNSDFNRYNVTSRLLMTYGRHETWVPIHRSSGFLANNYRNETELKSGWNLTIPVRFGEHSIHFDMSSKIVLEIQSEDSMEKVGNQLFFAREISVKMKCEASQLIEATTLHAIAAIEGTLSHFKVNQETNILLDKQTISVRDVEIATVLPFSFHVLQKYKLFDCYKGESRHVKDREWCQWKILQDKNTWITHPYRGRIAMNNVTRFS